MKISWCGTLTDLGFKKKGKFPEEEGNKITNAIERIEFRDFEDYKKNFEEYLASELAGRYTSKSDKLRVFKSIKSKIKDSGPFKQAVDLYNEDLRIAIEVEKTKETTLLLDIIKFIIGNKRNINGKSIIDYGVLIIPDKYRNEKYPDGQGSNFISRLKNDLAFINQILFVKDILIVVYDTSEFFNKFR